MHYRRKPVVVEATQYDGSAESIDRISLFTHKTISVEVKDHEVGLIRMDSDDGALELAPGDWLVRGVNGVLFTCKPDTFAATYDRIDQAEASHQADRDTVRAALRLLGEDDRWTLKADAADAALSRILGTEPAYSVVRIPSAFNFGLALHLLKQGRRLRRTGWNGKGMFIYQMPGYLDGIGANPPTAKALGVPVGATVRSRPYLAMKDAQDMIVTGWLASQADLLAEDWELAE